MTRIKAFFTPRRLKVWIPCLVLVLLVAACLIWAHVNQARIYLFSLRHTSYEAPDLTAIETMATKEMYAREAFFALDKVTLTDTLMLINATHPLPEGYLPVLSEYNGAKMHPLMVNSYIALRDQAQKETDDRIYVTSDYRTREEQKELAGEEGNDLAAKPGCSEHESGLALDIAVKGFGGITFLESATGLYVQKHCHEYGFVIRYPYEKTEVTGIRYEPWHLRYVGAPHATLMSESNLTLEEYINFLAPDQWYSSGSYRILRTSSETVSVPEAAWESCTVSPDNTGYYIYTFRMS